MSEPGEQSGLARRLNSSRLFDALLPFFATILALVVGAVLLTILGINPLTAYGSLLRGAFGTVSGFTQTLAKSTPLLLVCIYRPGQAQARDRSSSAPWRPRPSLWPCPLCPVCCWCR